MNGTHVTYQLPVVEFSWHMLLLPFWGAFFSWLGVVTGHCSWSAVLPLHCSPRAALCRSFSSIRVVEVSLLMFTVRILPSSNRTLYIWLFLTSVMVAGWPTRCWIFRPPRRTPASVPSHFTRTLSPIWYTEGGFLPNADFTIFWELFLLDFPALRQTSFACLGKDAWEVSSNSSSQFDSSCKSRFKTGADVWCKHSKIYDVYHAMMYIMNIARPSCPCPYMHPVNGIHFKEVWYIF